MQTHFSAAQLADPQVSSGDGPHPAGMRSLRVLYGDLSDVSADGRRARWTARAHLSGEGHAGENRPADATTVKHLDRCLTCLSWHDDVSVVACHYMHLVDHARQHIERTYKQAAVGSVHATAAGIRAAAYGAVSGGVEAGAASAAAAGLFPKRMQVLLDAAAGRSRARGRPTAAGNPKMGALTGDAQRSSAATRENPAGAMPAPVANVRSVFAENPSGSRCCPAAFSQHFGLRSTKPLTACSRASA